jgi:hypothetical protein
MCVYQDTHIRIRTYVHAYIYICVRTYINTHIFVLRVHRHLMRAKIHAAPERRSMLNALAETR